MSFSVHLVPVETGSSVFCTSTTAVEVVPTCEGMGWKGELGEGCILVGGRLVVNTTGLVMPCWWLLQRLVILR